jgi:hypothetical protein
VSSKNEVISDESFEKSFDEIFEFVSDKISKISQNVQIVLIPSLEDINHHFVMPQPPFEQFKRSKNVIFHFFHF